MAALDSEELLIEIYNGFDPRPLPAGDQAYVDCREVRGDVDVLQDLGKAIRRSKTITCQLYSGYRGTGKTTELLRLKADLEERGFFVVYFAADEEDISVQDTEYEDILLACTRHLLDQLNQANSQPIANWLRDRFSDLGDFFSTEITMENPSIQLQISQFAKLTSIIRTEPSQRQQIRDKVKPHTETLIRALNILINDAKTKLPDGKQQLVIIADNLDRIVPAFRDSGRSNHEEIFLDRNEQLKALQCHVIYTVPISMVYSQQSTNLKDNYGITHVLPSIMVQTRDGERHPPGIDKLKEAIAHRIKPFAPEVKLEGEIFESKEVLDQLCLMSGGYLRDLMQLAQEATNRIDALPITSVAVQRAIDEVRSAYQRAVEENQWDALAKVHINKDIDNDNLYRSLLFNRCLLE